MNWCILGFERADKTAFVVPEIIFGKNTLSIVF